MYTELGKQVLGCFGGSFMNVLVGSFSWNGDIGIFGLLVLEVAFEMIERKSFWRDFMNGFSYNLHF